MHITRHSLEKPKISMQGQRGSSYSITISIRALLKDLSMDYAPTEADATEKLEIRSYAGDKRVDILFVRPKQASR